MGRYDEALQQEKTTKADVAFNEALELKSQGALSASRCLLIGFAELCRQAGGGHPEPQDMH